MRKGFVDSYLCVSCGFLTVTRWLVAGPTPFSIPCQQPTQKCNDKALTLYGNVGNASPTHEWYRAELPEVRALDPGHPDSDWLYEHWKRGGLFLRKIEGK